MSGIPAINFTSGFTVNEMVYRNSDGTSRKILLSANSDTRIYSIMGTCSDVTARPIQLYLSDGITDYLAYTINIPANAGFVTNVNPVDIMLDTLGSSLMRHSYDSSDCYYLTIPSGWSLKGNLISTISSPYNVIITISSQTH